MTDTLTTSAAEGPRFSISRSLSMTFGVLGRNIVPMMLIALVVTAIQGVIEYILTGGVVEGESRGSSSFLNILSYGFITAPVTYATFQDLRGTRVGISGMMSGGFKKIARVIGAALAVGIVVVVPVVIAVMLYFASDFIGIAAGIAAAVFAFFILVTWFVLVPVQVVEDVSFTAGFGRAAGLSKGRRWGIFGLLLVYFVLIIVISIVIFGIVGVISMTAPIVGLILMIPFLALYSVLGAIMPSVVYYLLRAEKEGIGIDEIAKVFD
ncbi:MAG TPA: hypothetical protein VJ790_00905 [Dongiaceae bacterium]|nr:hypothetical protein [Dongiaceae bacterium]